MRLLCFAILIIIPFSLAAQDLPTPIVGNPFAKPGIRNASPGRALSVEYDRHPNYRLKGSLADGQKTSNVVEAKERFEAKIKFPLFLKGHWKVLGDVYHSFEKYRFEDDNPMSNYALESIDDASLKRTRLTTYIFRAMSPKYYIAFRAEASSNGKFDGFIDFHERYLVYRAAGMVGYKRTEDTEFGLGVMVNDGFARTLVYPFLIFNHNFNENWGLETVLPIKYELRRNIDPKNFLTFSAEYWSSGYSLDLKAPTAAAPEHYIFKSSAIQFFIEWQHNILSEWTWVAFKAGYSSNIDSKFVLEGTRDGGQIDAFPSNSVFFSASFFLSPPKKFMEANMRKK